MKKTLLCTLLAVGFVSVCSAQDSTAINQGIYSISINVNEGDEHVSNTSLNIGLDLNDNNKIQILEQVQTEEYMVKGDTPRHWIYNFLPFEPDHKGIYFHGEVRSGEKYSVNLSDELDELILSIEKTSFGGFKTLERDGFEVQAPEMNRYVYKMRLPIPNSENESCTTKETLFQDGKATITSVCLSKVAA